MQLASSFKGQALCAPAPLRAFVPFVPKRLTCRAEERLRLHNLSPAKGSRRQEKRKGRGHAAGQGGTCGFGNRGQKSRSGPGVRPGFEGGQTPLYRRLPKLRGIAGGMSAGISKHVVVNLDDLEKVFEENAVVTLDELKKKNLLNVSGRSADLPLKVLGTGTLSKPLVIKAAKFSSSALEKIQSAGGSVEVIPGKEKWTRKAHEQKVKEFAEKGLDYHKEMAKKRAAAAKAKAKKSVKS